MPWLLALFLALLSSFAQATVLQDSDEVAEEDLIVREVVFEGLDTYSEEGVLRALGVVIGEPLPELRPGVQRAWDIYRLLVTRSAVELFPGGGIRLVLVVSEQPVDLDPKFFGNNALDLETLYEMAGVSGRAEIYGYEADSIRSRLIEGYKHRGYYHVEIDVIRGGLPGETDSRPSDLYFEIREGPRVRSTEIIVRGNDSLEDTGWWFWSGGLKSLAKLQTKGRGIFRWWGKPFDEEALDADLVAMRKVYRDRGWLDAKVEVENLEFNEERDRVKVHIVVDEGPLWLVSDVDIVAMASADQGEVEVEAFAYPKEELLALLNLKRGEPLESARVLNDNIALEAYYGKRGHVASRFFPGGENVFVWLEPDQLLDAENQEVSVTYRILQGNPRTIREIEVVGNKHTNDKVIRRAVASLPGQRVDMVELTRGLRRIRGLGFFDDVQDPRHEEPKITFSQVPGMPNLVDVRYEVEEGRVVDLELSGGVSSDSGLIGRLGVSMRNFQAGDLPSGFWDTFSDVYNKKAFHGNGETFEVMLSPGTEVSSGSVSYQHPDLFGDHFNRYTGFAEYETRVRRYTSHDEDRQSSSLLLGRDIDQGDLSIRFGPTWKEIDLRELDQDEDLPYTLTDSEGESSYQGAAVNLRYNTLDRRFAPRAGVLAEWRNTVYGGPFGGDNDLWVTELSYDKFFQLGTEEENVRKGVYMGLWGRVAQPFGDTDFAKYSERGFLGGSTRMKGFDFRGVGPNDGNYSLGGETALFTTLEVRFPIYTTPILGTSRRQEVLRLTPFVDLGVLGLDAWDLDLDDLRASAGVTFGLVQPIPLSFNFGFPLRDGDGDDLEVFSFRLAVR